MLQKIAKPFFFILLCLMMMGLSACQAAPTEAPAEEAPIEEVPAQPPDPFGKYEEPIVLTTLYPFDLSII